MALIGMAIYSTEENKKDDYLEKTLESLAETVDFTKHRLQVSVNGYTEKTKEIIEKYYRSDILSSSESLQEVYLKWHIIEKVIWNDTNIGTAEGINKVWQDRKPGEHAVKMDDDVVIHNSGWLDELEDIADRQMNIGQVGLKRKDCWENPNHSDPFYKSKLVMLDHIPGEKWRIVERVNHVMGTCVLHSSHLLDEVGYLLQPDVYGFDDSFMSLRSTLAGFINVFIPHIEIDHIDPGDTPYQKWKEVQASLQWDKYHKTIDEFKTGKRSIYYNPFKL